MVKKFELRKIFRNILLQFINNKITRFIREFSFKAVQCLLEELHQSMLLRLLNMCRLTPLPDNWSAWPLIGLRQKSIHSLSLIIEPKKQHSCRAHTFFRCHCSEKIMRRHERDKNSILSSDSICTRPFKNICSAARASLSTAINKFISARTAQTRHQNQPLSLVWDC